MINLTELLATKGFCVGVEAEKNSLVAERVLLLGPRPLLDLLTCGADDRLDLRAVDDASNIGVGDLGRGEAEAQNVSHISDFYGI